MLSSVGLSSVSERRLRLEYRLRGLILAAGGIALTVAAGDIDLSLRGAVVSLALLLWFGPGSYFVGYRRAARASVARAALRPVAALEPVRATSARAVVMTLPLLVVVVVAAALTGRAWVGAAITLGTAAASLLTSRYLQRWT